MCCRGGGIPAGLFHQYIMQSGTALTTELWLLSDVYMNRTIRLGEHFGCPTNTFALLVDCLRGLSFSHRYRKLFDENEWFPTITWFPGVEPDIEGAFLTETTEKLFAAGKIRDLPSIDLCGRDEALVLTERLYRNMGLFEDILNDITYTLPRMLEYFDPDHENRTAYNTALKSYYLNDLSADKNVYRVVLGNTYDVTGSLRNYTSIAHGDDLIYLFQGLRHHYGPPHYSSSDVDWSTMVDVMVELWTSFATHGIADSTGTFAWDRYSKLNNYLRIGNGTNDTRMEMKRDFRKEHMQFWKQLLETDINRDD